MIPHCLSQICIKKGPFHLFQHNFTTFTFTHLPDSIATLILFLVIWKTRWWLWWPWWLWCSCSDPAPLRRSSSRDFTGSRWEMGFAANRFLFSSTTSSQCYKMSRIWRIYPCKKIGHWHFATLHHHHHRDQGFEPRASHQRDLWESEREREGAERWEEDPTPSIELRVLLK